MERYVNIVFQMAFVEYLHTQDYPSFPKRAMITNEDCSEIYCTSWVNLWAVINGTSRSPESDISGKRSEVCYIHTDHAGLVRRIKISAFTNAPVIPGLEILAHERLDKATLLQLKKFALSSWCTSLDLFDLPHDDRVKLANTLWESLFSRSWSQEFLMKVMRVLRDIANEPKPLGKEIKMVGGLTTEIRHMLNCQSSRTLVRFWRSQRTWIRSLKWT